MSEKSEKVKTVKDRDRESYRTRSCLAIRQS